jgi:hypothetical protein
MMALDMRYEPSAKMGVALKAMVAYKSSALKTIAAYRTFNGTFSSHAVFGLANYLNASSGPGTYGRGWKL